MYKTKIKTGPKDDLTDVHWSFAQRVKTNQTKQKWKKTILSDVISGLLDLGKNQNHDSFGKYLNHY